MAGGVSSWAKVRRGDFLDEEERFEILVCPENGDGVYTQVMKLESIPNLSFNFDVKEIPHVETGIELLRDGLCDMLAVSANWWYNNRTNDLSASIVMPRREPTSMLISEDKPEYIPNNGIIIAYNEITRRQMLRARPDIDVKLPTEFGDVPSSNYEFVNWLEKLRNNNEIDGYIIPRSLNSIIDFRTRKHTLGLQRENPVRFRFVPIPLEGYTILLSRIDFPAHKLASIVDQGAALSMRMEFLMLDSIPSEMHNRIALFVEQRKVATVLNEAEKAGDELARKGMINRITGEIEGSTRIYSVIETINNSGDTTASVEKVFPPEDSHSSILTVLNNWNLLLTVMQEENHKNEKRGRIKEIMDAYIAEQISLGSINADDVDSPMMTDL